MRVVQIGARPDADLHRIDAELDQVARRICGRHVAGHDLCFRQSIAQGLHGIEHTLGVTVGGIDAQDVDLFLVELLSPLEKISGGPDRRTGQQAALVVLGGIGIVALFLDVLDGDQAFETPFFIDDRQLLDAVLVQNAFGILERGADADRDEAVLGHHIRDRLVEVALEAQIPVREDADQLAVFRYGHAGDAVALHEVERFPNLVPRRDRDRVDDHAALRAFHAVDLLGLPLDRHVAVNEAKAALTGKPDGEVGFGDGVHRRADDGDVQGDAACERGGSVGLGGDDRAEGREQEDVVERQRFPNRQGDHTRLYGQSRRRRKAAFRAWRSRFADRLES